MLSPSSQIMVFTIYKHKFTDNFGTNRYRNIGGSLPDTNNVHIVTMVDVRMREEMRGRAVRKVSSEREERQW